MRLRCREKSPSAFRWARWRSESEFSRHGSLGVPRLRLHPWRFACAPGLPCWRDVLLRVAHGRHQWNRRKVQPRPTCFSGQRGPQWTRGETVLRRKLRQLLRPARLLLRALHVANLGVCLAPPGPALALALALAARRGAVEIQGVGRHRALRRELPAGALVPRNVGLLAPRADLEDGPRRLGAPPPAAERLVQLGHGGAKMYRAAARDGL
mmetsp:Transcript_46032/g.144343  ORF Transcript_46032/g.144343 Transcript_46032/m.144343 type:complete len:210 (+) Transcript_46032:388-1017(+)